MHYSNLDAFFHMASRGDTEAYEKLYLLFKRRCQNMVNTIVSNYSNFTGIPDDFSVYIDGLFFKAICEYDSARGSFSWFADYLVNNRLRIEVLSSLSDLAEKYADVNELLDEKTFEDVFADPEQDSVPKEVSKNSFQYKIASPNKNKTILKRKIDRILLLKYAGYTQREIRSIMNLSRQNYRTLLEKAQEDEDMINFKIDMK